MQTGDDILFTAPGPDFGTIPTATTEIVGTPGNALNVYWIVTHFPVGSVVSGPFPQKSAPNVLDDENYVHISWLPTLGALSYDLLFTEELELPRQPGRFLLAANLTGTEFRDTGQDLDLYDLAGIRYGAPQQEWIFFDNRDRKQPTLRFIPWPIEVSSIIFEDGTSQDTAGGGRQTPWLSDIDANGFSIFNLNEINGVPVSSFGPAGAPGQIQFATGTPLTFGASQNLTWDNTNRLLTVGTETGIRAFLWGGVFGNFHELDIDANPLNLCRIDQSNGLVGIGVQFPRFKLDVWEQINVTGSATGTGVQNPFFLSFSNSQSPATDQRIGLVGCETDSALDSGVLVFRTASFGVMSEVMRINSQGRVDIIGSLFINGVQVIP